MAHTLVRKCINDRLLSVNCTRIGEISNMKKAPATHCHVIFSVNGDFKGRSHLAIQIRRVVDVFDACVG